MVINEKSHYSHVWKKYVTNISQYDSTSIRYYDTNAPHFNAQKVFKIPVLHVKIIWIKKERKYVTLNYALHFAEGWLYEKFCSWRSGNVPMQTYANSFVHMKTTFYTGDIGFTGLPLACEQY